MLEQYKKTFKPMQGLIAFVTCSVLIWLRAWNIAAGFFLVMQIGAVLGAFWASSLKSRILQRRAQYLAR
jgi:hypothetical protein